MVNIESEAKHLRRRGSIEKTLLAALAISGMVLVAMAAPNVLQLLKYVPKNKYRFLDTVESAGTRLAKKGLVRFVKHGNNTKMELTPLGERAVRRASLQEELHQKSKKRWDKRWRMIIFDIPERRRKTRIKLREILLECGFFKLQNSVWVLPYDCEEIITLIKADLGVGKDILYTIVEKIEYDISLRKHFNLQ